MWESLGLLFGQGYFSYPEMLQLTLRTNSTEGGENMAKTHGGKKIVYVHPHRRSNGTRVKPHYRSTPN